MKKLVFLSVLCTPALALAQDPGRDDLSYTYAELRYVDVDENGGDGLRFNGSYDLGNNWIIVGGITSLEFNQNVDYTTIELGGGYVYPYNDDFDLVATARFIDAEIDTPVGDADDSGLGLSAGLRGLIAPQFEVRGSVNYVNIDESDTYLELAGDYYFTPRFAAGLSLEFAGDSDLLTLGGRWFFR
ncbi:outer membrane beta-barrel protein [Lentisalinibacter sediminis]|uniref:outer membrane beta-barrel protein n=1 Tax=Lentisalinibacter sediminis TaxID=2992237 RepID=UPI0038688A26